MTAPTNVQNVQVQPLNVPSKPTTSGPATGKNQKDRRYLDTFWDTHRHPRRFPNGRPWTGPRELAANRESSPAPDDGFVIGDLMQGQYVELEDGSCDRGSTLASAWSAPWTPFAKYFKFNYKRKVITLEYARMRLDEEQGLRNYWKACSKMSNRLGLAMRDNMPPSQVLEEFGEPSRMIQIAEAAMAGDPWLLGFIDEPNLTLAEILNIPTERGLIGLGRELPEPMMSQAEKVEAVNAAAPSVDLLQMLAEMTRTMQTMQSQITHLSAPKKKPGPPKGYRKAVAPTPVEVSA